MSAAVLVGLWRHPNGNWRVVVGRSDRFEFTTLNEGLASVQYALERTLLSEELCDRICGVIRRYVDVDGSEIRPTEGGRCDEVQSVSNRP